MTQSRIDFFNVISLMKNLVNDQLLTDVLPVSSEHNEKARILRNGLAVSAFSTLETYLEDNLEEQIALLSKSKISFNSFDNALKKFFTVEAVTGFANRINNASEIDKLNIAQDYIPKLAKFGQGRPVYSAMGFSPRGSNIGEKDILAVLKLFGLGGGWQTLSSILNTIGAGIMSLEVNFRNFSSDRNKAAHTITHNIPTDTLVTHLETAIRVGIAFDIATSFCIRNLQVSSSFSAFKNSLSLSNLSLRFLDEKPQGWDESLNGIFIKNHPDFTKARIVTSRRRGREMIVVRDMRGFPISIM